MSFKVTAEVFLKDVDQHRFSIKRDEGLYRHLILKRPNSYTYLFEILTWPGSLCIHGDCGTYVFSQLEDMFTFFRRHEDEAGRNSLPINLSYWAEKVSAQDKCSPTEEFDLDLAIQIVRDELIALKESDPHLDEEKIGEALRILQEADHSSYGFQDEIRRLSEELDIEFRDEFYDLFDHRFTEYTSRFRWCCYAIVWAIVQWDSQRGGSGDEGTRKV